MGARVGKRWIVLGAAGLGLLGGALTLVVAPSGYTATGTLLVSSASTTLTDLEGQTSFSAQAAKSYAALATAPLVLEPVVRSLRLEDTPEQLAGRTSADSPADTALVEVSVTDPDPLRAARIDAAVQRELVRAAESLRPDAQVGAPLVVVQAPAASTTRSTRNVPLALLAGAGTGAGLGALLVLLPDLVRRRPAAGGLSAATA